MNKLLRFFGSVLLLASAGWALAAEAVTELGPREVVVRVTESLQQLANGAAPDAEAQLGRMQEILDPVVDFGFIARTVMGDAARTASPAQVRRFQAAFRDSLVATYAKGMSSYMKSEIKIPELPAEQAKQSRVAVRQEIKVGTGVQLIDYTMAKNRKTGEWKLINVVLNGINLGKTFRSQFAQSLKQHQGDLDKVIDSWAAAPEAPETSASAH